MYFSKDNQSPPLKLTVHGNSKIKTNIYVRSSESLKEEIKKQSQSHESITSSYNKLVEKKIPEASLSEIPKNRKQFANFKCIINRESKDYFSSKDELYDALCNMGDGSCVRCYEIVHNTYRTVCFSDQQIIDLVRFCVNGNSIVNIDTTFKLGDFYVTLMVFRNLCLWNNRTKQHPLYLGISHNLHHILYIIELTHSI